MCNPIPIQDDEEIPPLVKKKLDEMEESIKKKFDDMEHSITILFRTTDLLMEENHLLRLEIDAHHKAINRIHEAQRGILATLQRFNVWANHIWAKLTSHH